MLFLQTPSAQAIAAATVYTTQANATGAYYAVTVNGKYLVVPNPFTPASYSSNPADIPLAFRFTTQAAAQSYVDAVGHRFKSATWAVVAVSQ